MANQSKYRSYLESVKPVAKPERIQSGRLRATPRIKATGGRTPQIKFSKPIQSRRQFQPFAMEDPDEARAVPETVFNGTILERIVYKRNLVLYGPPGPSSWDVQQAAIVRKGEFGGIKLDFVYYRVFPFLVLEPQGRVWHSFDTDYLDASRAFEIEGLGFRYAEIFEEDILSPVTDQELDRRIQDLVGNRIPRYPNARLTQPLPIEGIIRPLRTYKEDRKTF